MLDEQLNVPAIIAAFEAKTNHPYKTVHPEIINNAVYVDGDQPFPALLSIPEFAREELDVTLDNVQELAFEACTNFIGSRLTDSMISAMQTAMVDLYSRLYSNLNLEYYSRPYIEVSQADNTGHVQIVVSNLHPSVEIALKALRGLDDE